MIDKKEEGGPVRFDEPVTRMEFEELKRQVLALANSNVRLIDAMNEIMDIFEEAITNAPPTKE